MMKLLFDGLRDFQSDVFWFADFIDLTEYLGHYSMCTFETRGMPRAPFQLFAHPCVVVSLRRLRPRGTMTTAKWTGLIGYDYGFRHD